MKGIWLLLMTGILCLGTVSAAAQDSNADAAAIEAAVRNYIEGWFSSDAGRMEMALHPNLQKATVRTLQDGKTQYLDLVEAQTMVHYTGQNQDWVKGKQLEKPVEILYQDEHFAVVKAISTDFYDICGLVKLNGEWKILQVLWAQFDATK